MHLQTHVNGFLCSTDCNGSLDGGREEMDRGLYNHVKWQAIISFYLRPNISGNLQSLEVSSIGLLISRDYLFYEAYGMCLTTTHNLSCEDHLFSFTSPYQLRQSLGTTYTRTDDGMNHHQLYHWTCTNMKKIHDQLSCITLHL